MVGGEAEPAEHICGHITGKMQQDIALDIGLSIEDAGRCGDMIRRRSGEKRRKVVVIYAHVGCRTAFELTAVAAFKIIWAGLDAEMAFYVQKLPQLAGMEQRAHLLQGRQKTRPHGFHQKKSRTAYGVNHLLCLGSAGKQRLFTENVFSGADAV